MYVYSACVCVLRLISGTDDALLYATALVEYPDTLQSYLRLMSIVRILYYTSSLYNCAWVYLHSCMVFLQNVVYTAWCFFLLHLGTEELPCCAAQY